MLRPDGLRDMGGVAGQHGCGLHTRLRMDEPVVHIDTNDAAGIPNSPELLIRQVPADIAQGAAIGMRCHHRPFRQLQNIPKAAVAGVGHIREDSPGLHPAHSLPSQRRQPPVRVAACAAGQLVFFIPCQHPQPDTPCRILVDALQPVSYRLHALHHKKGKALPLRRSAPGLRRCPHRDQPRALCQLRPGTVHHELRPLPTVRFGVFRPETVLLCRCPQGQPQSANAARPQPRQMAALQHMVLSRQAAACHIVKQVRMSVKNHHPVSLLPFLYSIFGYRLRRKHKFL